MRSPHVCALTGLSYRQLDYLTRSPLTAPLLAASVPHRGAGLSNRRAWPRPVVRRLMIAAHTHRAGVGRDLPALTALLLTGPEPPDRGWLILGSPTSRHPAVAYVAGPAELADRITTRGARCQVIDYDLHDLAAAAGVTDLEPVLAGAAIPESWLTATERRRYELIGAL